MILTPALTRRSANSWAPAAGAAGTPTTISPPARAARLRPGTLPGPRTPRSPRPCPHSIEPGAKAGFVQNEFRDGRAVDLDDRDSLQMAAQQQLVALDVDLVQGKAVALLVQGDDRGDRLFAEVAPGPRIDDDVGHTAGRWAENPRVSAEIGPSAGV